MTLAFTRLSDVARPPRRAHDGDAGYDLFAAEAARLGPGERASVGTGIAVAIPVPTLARAPGSSRAASAANRS